MTARRALVVEDSTAGRMLVAALLTQQGFEVCEAVDGITAVDIARAAEPELILLDVGLPGIDGMEACRRIRDFSDAYILMLSARDSELDKVMGLGAGADDYITKPFSTAELLARVAAVLRRPRREAAPQPQHARRFGALQIDPVGREATLEGRPLELTKLEFDLLDTLSAEPNVAFTRALLLERIWGYSWFENDHIIESHVSNLRSKLGDPPHAPVYVRTVRGIGYRMGSGV